MKLTIAVDPERHDARILEEHSRRQYKAASELTAQGTDSK
jgi:cytochrome oxidase Cu insertion factor (SCO1/SenC/PrrC family)